MRLTNFAPVWNKLIIFVKKKKERLGAPFLCLLDFYQRPPHISPLAVALPDRAMLSLY